MKWMTKEQLHFKYVAVSSGFDARQRQEICVYSKESRPAVEPTQARIQLVPGALKQTTHLQPVPRSRMVELYFTPPYDFMAWWWIN
jgi:hypothetical protein